MNQYRQLSPDERYMITRLRRSHYPMARIAELMGRSRSTLYRELLRNRTNHNGAYRAEVANLFPARRSFRE